MDKRMTLKDFAYLKLRTANTWLNKCRKSAVLEDPSTGSMVKGTKYGWNLHDSNFFIFIDNCLGSWVGNRARTHWKSASGQSYQIYLSVWRHFRCKMSLLLTCKILGLLVNTLVAYDKYPVLNRYNLFIPIQMQLSQKQESFCSIFFLICEI